MPSGSVDMVFADPPYNLSNDGTSVHAGRRVSVNKGSWDKSRGVAEDFDFHYSWIEACHRLLKPDGTLWVSGTYHSIYACGHALQVQGWRILNDIAWFKPNAPPNLGCRMFTASHETILWASKGKTAKHTFNYLDMKRGTFRADFIKKPNKQMRSVWAIATPGTSEKRYGRHPTQKPFRLMERIITASTEPGNLILDPFCGSATTGVAAVSGGGGDGSLALNPIKDTWTSLPSLDFAMLFKNVKAASYNGAASCSSEAEPTYWNRCPRSSPHTPGQRTWSNREGQQGMGRTRSRTVLRSSAQLGTSAEFWIMGTQGHSHQATQNGLSGIQGNYGHNHDRFRTCCHHAL